MRAQQLCANSRLFILLEIIYISFIRSLLEYGDALSREWCLGKVQPEAARSFTGSTMLISISIFMTGIHRLLKLFCKVKCLVIISHFIFLTCALFQLKTKIITLEIKIILKFQELAPFCTTILRFHELQEHLTNIHWT